LERPAVRAHWLALAAALPPLALVAAEAFLFQGDWQFPLDDSFIHLVFARSLAAGEGLAFQPGELVAGTTAPLWTALVALLAVLPGPLFLWVKLAGVACQAGVVLAAFDLGRRLELSRRRALFAAALVALTDWLVWSAPSGMEVPLFTWLSLAGIARHVAERERREPPRLSLLLFALAALSRPEGLLLLPLALLDRLCVAEAGANGLRLARPDWGGLLRGALLAALVLAPVGYAFHQISGSVFPTTLLAKSSGPPILLPQLRFLRGVLGILFTSHPWMTLLAAGGAVELARRWGGAKDRGLLLPLWAIALPVGSAMLSSGQEIAVGNFGRYFFPLLPALVILGVLALDRVPFGKLRSVGGFLGGVPVAGLALLALLLPTATGLVRAAGVYLTACANVRDSDVAAARWLAPRLDPRAVLAVNDIGAVRWILPNRVVDLVGIVDPPIAERRRRGVAARESYPAVLLEIVEERRPDFLLVFPSWYPLAERDPARYPRLQAWTIPDNIAMAGDMMALYATPWTRWPLTPPPGETGRNSTESP
jgi:hypothetical protein